MFVLLRYNCVLLVLIVFKLLSTIGKSRHAATSGAQSADWSASPAHLVLSDSEDDAEKENHYSKSNAYRNKSLIESSDDDFDQCEFYANWILIHFVTQLATSLTFSIFYVLVLVVRATPKMKPTSQKPCSAAKKDKYGNKCLLKTLFYVVWHIDFSFLSVKNFGPLLFFSSNIPTVSSDDDDGFEACMWSLSAGCGCLYLHTLTVNET